MIGRHSAWKCNARATPPMVFNCRCLMVKANKVSTCSLTCLFDGLLDGNSVVVDRTATWSRTSSPPLAGLIAVKRIPYR